MDPTYPQVHSTASTSALELTGWAPFVVMTTTGGAVAPPLPLLPLLSKPICASLSQHAFPLEPGAGPTGEDSGSSSANGDVDEEAATDTGGWDGDAASGDPVAAVAVCGGALLLPTDCIMADAFMAPAVPLTSVLRPPALKSSCAGAAAGPGGGGGASRSSLATGVVARIRLSRPEPPPEAALVPLSGSCCPLAIAVPPTGVALPS